MRITFSDTVYHSHWYKSHSIAITCRENFIKLKKKNSHIRLIEKYEVYAASRSRRYCSTALYKGRVCISGRINFPLSRDRSIRTELKEKTDPYTSEYIVYRRCVILTCLLLSCRTRVALNDRRTGNRPITTTDIQRQPARAPITSWTPWII